MGATVRSPQQPAEGSRLASRLESRAPSKPGAPRPHERPQASRTSSANFRGSSLYFESETFKLESSQGRKPSITQPSQPQTELSVSQKTAVKRPVPKAKRSKEKVSFDLEGGSLKSMVTDMSSSSTAPAKCPVLNAKNSEGELPFDLEGDFLESGLTDVSFSSATASAKRPVPEAIRFNGENAPFDLDGKSLGSSTALKRPLRPLPKPKRLTQTANQPRSAQGHVDATIVLESPESVSEGALSISLDDEFEPPVSLDDLLDAVQGLSTTGEPTHPHEHYELGYKEALSVTTSAVPKKRLKSPPSRLPRQSKLETML